MRRPKTLDQLLRMRMTEELTGDLVLDTALACAAQDMEWELQVWAEADSAPSVPAETVTFQEV